ncbi:MAG: V-type ATPase subunit [Nanoarchaeota archaeon]
MSYSSIPEDPYAFARISVMKGKLLKKADYDKLMKMHTGEIIKTLQDHGYSEDLAVAETKHAGSLLVEKAVAKNLEKTYQKLMRITNESLSQLIQLYLDRNDIWNLKNVLRAVNSGMREGVEELLLPVGSISKLELVNLLKKNSVKDVTDSLKQKLGKTEFSGISDIENHLTKNYYENALKKAESLPVQGEAMKNFIMAEVRTLNIITILKMKAAQAQVPAILNCMIGQQNTLTKTLISAQTLEAAFDILEKSEFKQSAIEGRKEWEENKSLVTVETSLYRALLRKNLLLLRKDPLSIDIILGYLFAKSIEAKNIRLISKGKELGLDMQFIEKELIIA